MPIKSLAPIFLSLRCISNFLTYSCCLELILSCGELVMYLKLVLSCREILQRSKSSLNEKPDVHTRLMEKYKEVPQSWFLGILSTMIVLSIIACEVYNDQLQLRWWGVLLACGLALFFTLPIGVITAITNQVCVCARYLHMLTCKSCCKLSYSIDYNDGAFLNVATM